MKIQILSDEMASRIAAGEVVERPASAVKELIENSLDASATEIFISVEKSGTASIRVSDNGEGMAPEDLNLAVERHATSKLQDAGAIRWGRSRIEILDRVRLESMACSCYAALRERVSPLLPVDPALATKTD